MLDADKLLLARRNAKLTQAQLAARLGVSRKTLTNWETGRYALPTDLDERLIGALAETSSAPASATNPVGRPPKRPAWMPDFPSAVWDTHEPWASWSEVRLWFYYQAVKTIVGIDKPVTPESLQAQFDAHLAMLSDSTRKDGHRWHAWEGEKLAFNSEHALFRSRLVELTNWLKQNGMDHALHA